MYPWVSLMKRKGKVINPRDPSAKLRSEGALRTRVVADKRKKIGRKVKHKRGNQDVRSSK